MGGVNLASQDLRLKIINGSIITSFTDFSLEPEDVVKDDRVIKRKGWFVDNTLERLVQPSSFEPRLREDCFVLDTEARGTIRPTTDASIYRSLLELPRRQRMKVDISNGFELKVGYTYLFPLEEKIKLGEIERLTSSPKSSFGRIFLHTRLLADFNPCFDEVNGFYKPDVPLDLWLMIQPSAFNVIVRPGLTLNQVRYFEGDGAQLSSAEIRKEFSKSPLLCIKNGDAELEAVKPTISEGGLQLHLDLQGRFTEGIVGLRARKNPGPINLSQKAVYDAEDFFEPLLARDAFVARHRQEHYLLASREVLVIPPHLCAELERHSAVGLIGPKDFAGFVDNKFRGDLVYELRSDELADMELVDGMPFSRLRFFATKIPDKLYGIDSGSHYQEQKGTRPAKFFKGFDFAYAAKNYHKLNREVLVQDAVLLHQFRRNREGFELIDEEKTERLNSVINAGFFHSRYDCEEDGLVLQPIPYVLLFGKNGTVFSYERANKIKDYGESKLFNKHSIGVGGHIWPADSLDYVKNSLAREVQDEVEIRGKFSSPLLVGTLMAYDKPVDHVHFGLIFGIIVDGDVYPKESSIVSGGMISIGHLLQDPNVEKYETWSRILIPQLKKIYERL